MVTRPNMKTELDGLYSKTQSSVSSVLAGLYRSQAYLEATDMMPSVKQKHDNLVRVEGLLKETKNQICEFLKCCIVSEGQVRELKDTVSSNFFLRTSPLQRVSPHFSGEPAAKRMNNSQSGSRRDTPNTLTTPSRDSVAPSVVPFSREPQSSGSPYAAAGTSSTVQTTYAVGYSTPSREASRPRSSTPGQTGSYGLVVTAQSANLSPSAGLAQPPLLQQQSPPQIRPGFMPPRPGLAINSSTGKVKQVRNISNKLCPICNKLFVKPSILLKHMRTHDPNRPKFTCQYCLKEFLHQDTVYEHWRRFHSDAVLLRCLVKNCKVHFQSLKSLRNHMSNHRTCVRCGVPCTVLHHCEEAANDKWRCTHEECQHTSETWQDLIQHMITVHYHLCRVCELCFTVKPNCDAHMSIFHSGLKSFACPICCIEFDSLQDFKVHINESAERMDGFGMVAKCQLFFCQRCNKSFDSISKLLEHVH